MIHHKAAYYTLMDILINVLRNTYTSPILAFLPTIGAAALILNLSRSRFWWGKRIYALFCLCKTSASNNMMGLLWSTTTVLLAKVQEEKRGIIRCLWSLPTEGIGSGKCQSHQIHLLQLTSHPSHQPSSPILAQFGDCYKSIAQNTVSSNLQPIPFMLEKIVDFNLRTGTQMTYQTYYQSHCLSCSLFLRQNKLCWRHLQGAKYILHYFAMRLEIVLFLCAMKQHWT